MLIWGGELGKWFLNTETVSEVSGGDEVCDQSILPPKRGFRFRVVPFFAVAVNRGNQSTSPYCFAIQKLSHLCMAVAVRI